MEEKKDYVDLPPELVRRAGAEVKKQATELMRLIADRVQGLVWQVANDYLHDYGDTELLDNYTDQVRQEVVRCAHIWCRDAKNIWGKSLRAKIFEEHKAEILPLIQTEQMAAKDKEIKKLQDQVDCW